jgi:hypothetical protein
MKPLRLRLLKLWASLALANNIREYEGLMERSKTLWVWMAMQSNCHHTHDTPKMALRCPFWLSLENYTVADQWLAQTLVCL